MEIRERNIDLEKLIKSIDITATMYKNAKEKYESIATFLNNQGIKAEIFPQGSFRMGTVVRPYREGQDKDYDLDVVCNLVQKKRESNPKNVKNQIGEELEKSDLYADKLMPEYDRCWTLQYAKVDGEVGFRLDVVPSVNEEIEVILRNVNLGISMDLAAEAIAITTKTNDNYKWDESNPRGYALWFDEINKPFLEYNKEERRAKYFAENKNCFNKVEDIPNNLDRSALQRIIQILKRHRDVYYSRIIKWDDRPISAILTTLAAKIASNAPKTLSIYELLEYVVKELKVYSELLDVDQDIFESKYANRKYIKRNKEEWTIRNPVNFNDVYTENWTKNTANLFFGWIKVVHQEIVENETFGEQSYYSGLSSGFGFGGYSDIIKLLKPAFSNNLEPTNVIKTKPWGMSCSE